jgi:Alpha/beta hydrolase
MQLRYISIAALIGEAGGDPWAINQSLQDGRPAQISDLAQAFHNAGRCTSESSAAFDEARRRFEASWNRENGEHPINDSDEVQRVTKSFGAQSLQLPKIGADLENIAAGLAEAQKAAAGQIATLEAQLEKLDNLVGQAVEMEKQPNLSAADRDALNSMITACEDDAIRDTQAAVGQVTSTRDGYSATLQNSLTTLRSDGYDPVSIQAMDGPQPPVPVLPDDPKQFTQAWNALTPQQKEAEYHQNPFIGNHPGMPFEDHTLFNERHLDELTRSTQASVDDMQAAVDRLAKQQYTGDHSADTADALAALAPKLQAAKHSLDEYRGVQNAMKAPPGTPKRYLGFLDDRGHAAVSIGNPDKAIRNAILVPGTGDDLTNIGDNTERSWKMYQSALKADPNLHASDLSVTAWLGYDRPMSVVEQAPWPSYAEHGAGALDSFEDGMRASHVGAPSIDTVIGHSYGTTLVGAAASGDHHLAANNIIAVASPGMLVDHAGDLHISPGGTVYAMTDPHDPIGPANLFTQFTLGPNPVTTDFGAHDLLAATHLGTGPDGQFPSLAAHGGYWNDRTPALANLGAVIAGVKPPFAGG